MSRRHIFATLLIGAMTMSLVGCNSGGSSVTNPIDLSPPQAPTNLHSDSDPSISRDWLAWDLSASATVAGYEVYSSPPGGTSTLVATVSSTSTDYLLPLVSEGTTEYYRVRAVGTNNVPSAFTSTVDVNRTPWDGSTPSSPPDPTHDSGF